LNPVVRGWMAYRDLVYSGLVFEIGTNGPTSYGYRGSTVETRRLRERLSEHHHGDQR
jgi:hypothetical protein